MKKNNKAHNLANTKYAAKNYDRILLRIRKDGETTREKIQNAAAAAGESVNEYILNAVRERMNQGPAATGDGKTEKENPPRVSDHIEENPGGVSSDPEENPGRDPEEKTGGALSSENITPEPVRTPFIEDP